MLETWSQAANRQRKMAAQKARVARRSYRRSRTWFDRLLGR